MILRLAMQPLFIALLCVSVLFVRGGGMHLHMCLDGQEAPTQVHWADSGMHNDAEHASESHDDRDIDLTEGVAKTSKSTADFSLAVLVAAILLTLLVVPRQAPPRLQRIFAPDASRFLRPPLRGPPR